MTDAFPPGPPGGLGSRVPRRRQWYGFAVAIIGAPLLTLLVTPIQDELGLDSTLMLFVLVSVIASAVGGLWPALVASLGGFGCVNFYFTPPTGSLAVGSRAELVDLLVFLAVSSLVGIITEIAARNRARAEHSLLEGRWLAELADREHGPGSVDQALAEARSIFQAHSATLLEGTSAVASTGQEHPGDQILAIPAGNGLTLRLSGQEALGQDRLLLESLAQTAGRMYRTERLAEQARRAAELARIDELRASLLAAVGHDLRNPLAAITVAADTLGQTGLELPVAERAELLATIAGHARGLNEIIGNLLDMSRLQVGAFSARLAPTSLLEVLGTIVRPGETPVVLGVPEDLPLLLADAGLLERVLANLVDNAARQAAGQPVTIRAVATGERCSVAVVDHGPGVDSARLVEMFAPFQHFDDRNTTGLGLGLAIARGFTEAMGGTLTAAPTPGGGLTMIIDLEVADAPGADR